MIYNTKIEKIDSSVITEDKIQLLKKEKAIQEGAYLLQQGEVVAFPTETVYGLGADATNEDAVNKIFKAKGRPQDNPLIVHIASRKQLDEIIRGEMPVIGEKLIEVFWPGPLTVILPKNSLIPDITTAGLESVAIRMPAHPVARALIELTFLPIAAPSANSSGYPSPTLAEHVFHDLKGKIPFIIDGGACQVGLESTVVDIRGDKPVILRPGGITREEIAGVLGYEVAFANNLSQKNKLRSPGMKYRHYSPKTPLILIEGNQLDEIEKLVEEYKGRRIALVVTDETRAILNELQVDQIIKMGSYFKPAEIAHNLFAILRQLDQDKFDLILMESIPEMGLGEAIMNRLHKAAIRR